MPSREYQRFLRELTSRPCDNPKRTGYAELRELQERRITTEDCGCPNVRQQMTQLGGRSAEWLIPPKAPGEKAVLYIHGGGWSLGGIRQTRRFLAPMAECFRVRTLHFDYRLMPEHPFPAGLDDCCAVYLALLEEGFRAEDMALAGESAGANLALALLLRMRDRGVPLPAAAALMSPITFLDSMEGSHTDLAPLDHILAEDSFVISEVAERYAPGADKRQPELSPLYGDLRGLPPMQIFVGTDELPFDDAVRFYQKSRMAGNEAELVVGDHMCHSWPIFMGQFPEAEAAVGAMAAFLWRYLFRDGKDHELYYERQLVRAALDEIERNYAGANLSRLAAAYNQTLYGYSKLIKQYTGHTFKQLLKNRRFSVAERKLIETDKSIKTIALESGYESLTHFYELFREKYGQTPQCFRRSARQNEKIAKDDSVFAGNSIANLVNDV